MSSEINSLCDKNAETIMELTDDCSRHLREDVKTQFQKHLNTLSTTTKAKCAKARQEVVIVEDIKLDFLEHIVALRY